MEQDKGYPKNFFHFRKDDPSMMQAVYGGPEYFAQQNPNMFQMAYAGPAAPQPAGAYHDPQQLENMPKRKWCPNCGMTIDASAKFCTECGEPQPQPKDDENA